MCVKYSIVNPSHRVILGAFEFFKQHWQESNYNSTMETQNNINLGPLCRRRRIIFNSTFKRLNTQRNCNMYVFLLFAKNKAEKNERGCSTEYAFRLVIACIVLKARNFWSWKKENNKFEWL